MIDSAYRRNVLPDASVMASFVEVSIHFPPAGVWAYMEAECSSVGCVRGLGAVNVAGARVAGAEVTGAAVDCRV